MATDIDHCLSTHTPSHTHTHELRPKPYLGRIVMRNAQKSVWKTDVGNLQGCVNFTMGTYKTHGRDYATNTSSIRKLYVCYHRGLAVGTPLPSQYLNNTRKQLGTQGCVRCLRCDNVQHVLGDRAKAAHTYIFCCVCMLCVCLGFVFGVCWRCLYIVQLGVCACVCLCLCV
jgi:hypothetical protein